jgi:hypothetical protein
MRQIDVLKLEGMAGSALRAEERSDEAPSVKKSWTIKPPDPEVVAKPTRRQFSAAY